MVRKVQIPVVGGLRKMVTVPEVQTPGTTIAEFGNSSITLAQLRAALGVTTTASGGSSGGGGTPPFLAPGPGLAGGGALIGNVPLQLVAPPHIYEDWSSEENFPPILGVAGPAGPVGPPGISFFDEAPSFTEMPFMPSLPLPPSLSTGAAIPTLGANKPGAGSAIAAWETLVINGTTYYRPLWT